MCRLSACGGVVYNTQPATKQHTYFVIARLGARLLHIATPSLSLSKKKKERKASSCQAGLCHCFCDSCSLASYKVSSTMFSHKSTWRAPSFSCFFFPLFKKATKKKLRKYGKTQHARRIDHYDGCNTGSLLSQVVSFPTLS